MDLFWDPLSTIHLVPSETIEPGISSRLTAKAAAAA